jgi:hypothetical protein
MVYRSLAGAVAVWCIPLLTLPRTYLVAQCALALLELAATFVALSITIVIARPLFREARLRRIEKETSNAR